MQRKAKKIYEKNKRVRCKKAISKFNFILKRMGKKHDESKRQAFIKEVLSKEKIIECYETSLFEIALKKQHKEAEAAMEILSKSIPSDKPTDNIKNAAIRQRTELENARKKATYANNCLFAEDSIGRCNVEFNSYKSIYQLRIESIHSATEKKLNVYLGEEWKREIDPVVTDIYKTNHQAEDDCIKKIAEKKYSLFGGNINETV